MSKTLHILHLEPNAKDAEMLYTHLRNDGIKSTVQRVETEADFCRELRRPQLDVILAERDCPGYGGYEALAAAQKERPELPFIFVSGVMEASEGIESLGVGATDFVLKEYPSKLAPAVRRGLTEARARAELERARARLMAQSELLDLANDSIIICDAEGRVTYWNRGSYRTYGWKREEVLGQDLHELLQTRFSDGERNEHEILRRGLNWEGELQQTRRDGTTIHVASRWTLHGEGKHPAVLYINSDITSQKMAEDALRQSEERYRRFVEADLTGNLIMQVDGSIVTCNPAFVRIFGFKSEEEALATNFMSLLRTRKDGAHLLALLREQRTIERHELEMRQLNGEPVYVAARLVGMFDPSGELTQVQGYLSNDTKRKRLEQQLVQAQKMEGLGTLAGGIAHDFNNILAIILGYTNQLEKWGPRPELVPGAIKVIKEAVDRGAALVQQLLTSARQTEAHLTAVDLNALARELEKMLHATFPKTINFELQLEPNLSSITADRSQIYQVLLNLCINSRDAMPSGGTLTLESSLVRGADLAEFFTGADGRDYACLRVRDTGSGMTPEVKAHIFEPFFTTKERAKGTGLGLSVVYGVVNNHRGFLQVDTAPGHGTTFSIYLPLHRTTTESAEDQPLLPRKTREPQTILVVEDEEMLRDLAIQILEAEGYRVLAARDGEEAVEMFEQHRNNVGLVVCDLGLPKLGGRDVFMKMKQSKPSVRAIVASGYLEPSVRSEILRAGVIDTIQKPYDFNDLVAKIQSVIGKAQSDDDHPQLF